MAPSGFFGGAPTPCYTALLRAKGWPGVWTWRSHTWPHRLVLCCASQYAAALPAKVNVHSTLRWNWRLFFHYLGANDGKYYAGAEAQPSGGNQRSERSRKRRIFIL